MIKQYVEFTFLLNNGNSRVVTVKDVKEDVTNNELKALADLFIEKNSQYQDSLFTELKKCQKYTVEVEDID